MNEATRVHSGKLRGHARLIAYELAMETALGGTARVTQSELAQRTGYSRPTIAKALRELESAGVIEADGVGRWRWK